MSVEYYIDRCPECGQQRPQAPEGHSIGHMCPTASRIVYYERVPVVVPEAALTDEMVKRGTEAAMEGPVGVDGRSVEETTRDVLLAASPWTREPDREKLIETVGCMRLDLDLPEMDWAIDGETLSRQAAERVVDAILEIL